MVFRTPPLATVHKLGLGPSRDYLRNGLVKLVQLLMEMDLSERIDAQHYERNEQRTTYRNGYRKRRWKTSVGAVNVRIPKLRKGTYYPDFLHHCEETLLTWLSQAYVDTQTLQYDLDNSLASLSLRELQPYEQAQLFEALHDLAKDERHHPIQLSLRDLWLDMVDLGRTNGIRQIVLVAVGIDHYGAYHPLDFEITSDADDERIWAAFLRRLMARGVRHIDQVISGDHGGLRSLANEVFGAEWQYQRPYELQDVLYYVSENNHMSLTDAVSTLYITQPDFKITYHLLDQATPMNLLASVA